MRLLALICRSTAVRIGITLIEHEDFSINLSLLSCEVDLEQAKSNARSCCMQSRFKGALQFRGWLRSAGNPGTDQRRQQLAVTNGISKGERGAIACERRGVCTAHSCAPEGAMISGRLWLGACLL
jgi:hypothetical protein